MDDDDQWYELTVHIVADKQRFSNDMGDMDYMGVKKVAEQQRPGKSWIKICLH